MEWKKEAHRIYVEDEAGELLAEITFPLVEEGVVDINHTFVSEVLRGQGMAGKLMSAAVEAIRENGWKARTSCSYAENWKGKHPENTELFA